MLSLFVVILLVVLLIRVTGLVFHVIGTVLGWVFGAFGWLFLAGLASTVFGLALVSVPVILLIGGVSLLTASAS